MARLFYGEELTETAWLRKFNELWAELPKLHGCRCSPLKEGLWTVTITGKTDVTVSGYPLAEALDRCIKKFEKKPSASRWASQAEYLAAWAAVKKRYAPAAPVVEKLAPAAPAPRYIPTFKAIPKKGKALEAEKAKQEKAANSKDAWSLF